MVVIKDRTGRSKLSVKRQEGDPYAGTRTASANG